MTIRTSFRFTLPNGSGVKTEPGRKAGGTMRLIQLKDLAFIERDSQVQKGTPAFYIVLLSKTITELGKESLVTRKTIEKLSPLDFSFLIDFMHEINHQVIKQIPILCPKCAHGYLGMVAQLGEA